MIKFPKLNANILDINIKNAISKKHTMTLQHDTQSKDRMFRLNDGKKVIVKGKGRLPVNKRTINKVYSKLPDNKNVPIVFQTKKSYLQDYIKNQELKHNVDFPLKQEKAYIKKELKGMKPIVSRFTTYHNDYMEPKTVFFTDTRWSPKQFKMSAAHEVGHELWDQNPKIKKDWRAVNKTTSPTGYGSSNRQEDFAESYMLHKMGKLKHPKRIKIMNDITSRNKVILEDEGYIEVNPFKRGADAFTNTSISLFERDKHGLVHNQFFNKEDKRKKVTPYEDYQQRLQTRHQLEQDITSRNKIKHFTARNKYNDKTMDLYYATLKEAQYKNPSLTDFKEVM